MRLTTYKQVIATFGVVGEITHHLIDIRGHENPLCLFVCSRKDVYDFFTQQTYTTSSGKPCVEVLFASDLKRVQQFTCGKEYSNIFFIGDVDSMIEAYVLSRHRRPRYTGPKTVTWFSDCELTNMGWSK